MSGEEEYFNHLWLCILTTYNKPPWASGLFFVILVITVYYENESSDNSKLKGGRSYANRRCHYEER